MKSLHTRLDDRKEEVLEITRTFGRFRAMEQFHVKDYKHFSDWLEEVTKDANFGLNPKIKPYTHEPLGDQLVDAFLRKVAQLEAENERLKQRANFLEWQLKIPEQKEQNQALAVLQTCEV